MKRQLYLFIILGMIFFSFINCSSGNEDLNIGTQEVISINKNKLEFSKNEESVTLTTDKPAWGIGCMIFCDNSVEIRYDNEFYMKRNLNQSVYQCFMDTMSYAWITVIKSVDDPNSLFIEVKENKTGKDRTVLISLIGSIGFGNIDVTVNQKGN